MSALAALFLSGAMPMVVIDEPDTIRREPPPHGEIGMSPAEQGAFTPAIRIRGRGLV